MDHERRDLDQACLRLLLEDFAQHATALLEDARKQRPYDYLRLVASMLPKELRESDGEATQIREIRTTFVDPRDRGE